MGNVPADHHDHHISHFFDTYNSYIHHAPEHHVPDLAWDRLKHSCVHATKSGAGLDDWSPAHFFDTYNSHIHHAPEHHIPDLAWDRFKHSCIHATRSAAGLDDWSPADFSLLSDSAYQWLAKLLNLIEHGAPWPSGTLHAKASFLPEAAANLADPMAYRILFILPTIYRRWASTRLHDLYPWVDTWSNSHMFAGIPGLGAADGWYQTAIQLEFCKVFNIPFAGGAVDIFKCFDQIHMGAPLSPRPCCRHTHPHSHRLP